MTRSHPIITLSGDFMWMRSRPNTGNIKTLQRYTGILRSAEKARIAIQGEKPDLIGRVAK